MDVFTGGQAALEPGTPGHLEHLATLHFSVVWAEMDQPPPAELVAGQIRQELSKSARAIVAGESGGQFQVGWIEVRAGSCEIALAIYAAMAWKAIADYKSVIENLQLLGSHLKQLIGHLIAGVVGRPAAVSVGWSPGPALLVPADRQRGPSQAPLITYLMAMNAVLVATLIAVVLVKTL